MRITISELLISRFRDTNTILYHIIYLGSLVTSQPDLDLQEYVLPPGILHHIDDKLRQTDGEPRRNFAVVQVAATKQYSFRQIDF